MDELLATVKKLHSVDWVKLEKLANRSNIIEKIFDIFFEESSQLLDNIDEAVSKKDPLALSNLFHKLHGACRYCELSKLSCLVSYTEKRLKNNEKDPKLMDEELLKKIINNIKKEITAIKKAYKSYILSHKE